MTTSSLLAPCFCLTTGFGRPEDSGRLEEEDDEDETTSLAAALLCGADEMSTLRSSRGELGAETGG